MCVSPKETPIIVYINSRNSPVSMFTEALYVSLRLLRLSVAYTLQREDKGCAERMRDLALP